MSGTANVANSFAAAVTATGAQLDANYTTIVAYLNDPTNRNNYVSDTGNTNTVALTFVPPFVGGYTAGAELTWKWAQTNTTAVVINANGLGNINLVNPDGTAMQNGQGVIGSIGKAVYDGTRAVYISSSAQRSQEAKVWGVITQTTSSYSIASAFNTSSVSRSGTGTVSIGFSVTMSSTLYPALINANAQNSDVIAKVVTKFTTGMIVLIRTHTTNDPLDNNFEFVIFGATA